MTSAQRLALARAFAALQERIDETPVNTKCARNYHGVPTHKCTGGRFCKGNCKPHGEVRRRTANIAE